MVESEALTTSTLTNTLDLCTELRLDLIPPTTNNPSFHQRTNSSRSSMVTSRPLDKDTGEHLPWQTIVNGWRTMDSIYDSSF